MDYRRRYLRRLANQNQENVNEENASAKKNEVKNNVPEKIEEKANTKNIYLQKLLGKNSNSPTTSSNNISKPNENVAPYSSNIRDNFATEGNRQKTVKYVFHKRIDDKSGIDNIKEESNPQSSKYNNYRNTSKYTKVESNQSDIINKSNNETSL